MHADLGIARTSSRSRRRYNLRWRPEDIIVIVVVILWVITIFRVGHDLDLSPQLPASGTVEHFLDGPVALLRTHKPVKSKRRLLDYYLQLHERSALAINNENVTYPDVRWPLYDGTMFAPPSDAQLGNGTYANASNPYMVVAYNGSFFNQKWPTHQ